MNHEIYPRKNDKVVKYAEIWTKKKKENQKNSKRKKKTFTKGFFFAIQHNFTQWSNYNYPLNKEFLCLREKKK